MLDWIAAPEGHENLDDEDDSVNEGLVEDLSSPGGLKNFYDILPIMAIDITIREFTCPNCRASFTIQTLPEHRIAAIEVQLQFWDLAYENFGVIRSDEEDASRQDFWRFVKETKPLVKSRIPKHVLRARVSVMQFALRRARRDLTPVHCQLRDALYNFGCHSLDRFNEEQQIPSWCWQFKLIERGINPNHHQTKG